MFGAGTACIVCPVERILYKDEWLNIPTMKDGGPVVNKFLNDLTDIHVSFSEYKIWLERSCTVKPSDTMNLFLRKHGT